jgi:hypothetical protein
MPAEIVSINSGAGKIRSATEASGLSYPFTRLETRRAATSGTSSAVTTHGPMAAWVSSGSPRRRAVPA